MSFLPVLGLGITATVKLVFFFFSIMIHYRSLILLFTSIPLIIDEWEITVFKSSAILNLNKQPTAAK